MLLPSPTQAIRFPSHVPSASRTVNRSARSEEHTSELQSQSNLVCRLLLEKKKNIKHHATLSFFFFFFNDTATTEIYTLSLHDALPISARSPPGRRGAARTPALAPLRSSCSPCCCRHPPRRSASPPTCRAPRAR